MTDPCKCDHDFTQHYDPPQARRVELAPTVCFVCECQEYIPTAWTPEQAKMRRGDTTFRHPDWLE